MAWSVEELRAVGGRLWEKNGVRRVYFNDLLGLLGYAVSYYKTGNVSSATLDGDRISNSSASAVSRRLAGCRFWYDLDTEMYGSRGLEPNELWRCAEAIRVQLETLRSEEMAS